MPPSTVIMCPVIFLALKSSTRQELKIFKALHLLLRGQEYDGFRDFSRGSDATHRDVFNNSVREAVELGFAHAGHAV